LEVVLFVKIRVVGGGEEYGLERGFLLDLNIVLERHESSVAKVVPFFEFAKTDAIVVDYGPVARF